MKSMILIFLVFGLGDLVFSQTQSDTTTMTYIKYRLDSPGFNEFGKAPREMWRVSNVEMTSREAVDSANELHQMIIYNPPDFWMVNLYDSTAFHGIDKGPTFYSFAPIFTFTKSKAYMEFEFGFEISYVQKRKIMPSVEVISDTLSFHVYEFEIENSYINLIVNANTNLPIKITAKFEGVVHLVIYEEYMTGLEIDSSVFLPPDGLVIKETD